MRELNRNEIYFWERYDNENAIGIEMKSEWIGCEIYENEMFHSNKSRYEASRVLGLSIFILTFLIFMLKYIKIIKEISKNEK